MALQKAEKFATGIVAPEAYTVIMAAQINKAASRIEAEVHVYYNEACSPKKNPETPFEPLKRFAYMIEDNGLEQLDTTLWLNVIGVGDITITDGKEVLATVTVGEDMFHSETLLQDIADALQHDSLTVTVLSNNIIVKAVDKLKGGAGADINVFGEAIQVIHRVIGCEAVASDLETYFGLPVQEQQGVTLQKQIYEHMKDKDPRYVDAIDV